jgi:hypothetical protein
MRNHGFLTAVVAASLAGVVTFLLMPPQWAERMFLLGIVLTAILAIVASIDTSESRPVHALLGVLLVLLVGTPRPASSVDDGPSTIGFVVSAAYAFSIGLCFVWGAHA